MTRLTNKKSGLVLVIIKFMVVSSDEERIWRKLKLSILVSSDEDRIPMAHFWKSYTAKLDLTSEL